MSKCNPCGCAWRIIDTSAKKSDGYSREEIDTVPPPQPPEINYVPPNYPEVNLPTAEVPDWNYRDDEESV